MREIKTMKMLSKVLYQSLTLSTIRRVISINCNYTQSSNQSGKRQSTNQSTSNSNISQSKQNDPSLLLVDSNGKFLQSNLLYLDEPVKIKQTYTLPQLKDTLNEHTSTNPTSIIVAKGLLGRLSPLCHGLE